MFDKVVLRGGPGALLWGYREAAVLSSWTIAKQKDHWRLSATLTRADTFQCRQKPLLFTAPRHKGMWAWPLVGEAQIEQGRLQARLGPPEQ
jgi:hypothetical protein